MNDVIYKNFYEQHSENYVAFFMSDLHLSLSTADNIQKLESFVKHLIDAKSKANLYFMGDTFDFWFGYASPIEKEIQPLLIKIKNYKSQSGAQVVFFEGNHDIHLGPYFKSLGFGVETNRKIVTSCNKRLVLEHGDMFDPEDKGYMLLRSFLRSNLIRFLGVRVLPTKLVSGLGNFFSNLSAKKTRVVDPERQKRSREVFLSYGIKSLKFFEADVFIAGHTHQRMISQDSRATVINLGSWCDGDTVICAQNDTGFQFISI